MPTSDAAPLTNSVQDCLLQAAPVGLCWIDAELRCIHANECLATMVGKPVARIIGQRLSRGIPAIARRVEGICRRAMTTREPVHDIELRVHAANEEHTRTWLTSYHPVLSRYGTLRGVVCVFKDVTDQRRAEDRLRKRQKEFYLLAQRVPAHFSYLGPDLRYRFVNRRFEELFGIPRKEIVGKHVRDLIGDEAFGAISEYFRIALDGWPATFEAHLRTHPAGPRWMAGEFVPDIDKDGRTVGLFALVRDVTKQKRVEEELKERLRFEQLLSTISTTLSNNGQDNLDHAIEDSLREILDCLHLDRGSVQRLDESRRALIATHSAGSDGHVFDSGSPERHGWLIEALCREETVSVSRVQDLPLAACVEIEYCRTQGIRSFLAFPLVVAGAVTGAVVFASFTERSWSAGLIQRLRLVAETFATAIARNRSEQHARHLRGELAHIARLTQMNELATALAHGLNQPLAAITNYAQGARRFLARPGESTADLDEAFRAIATETQRAKSIIQRVRGFLRRGVPSETPLNVNDVIREVEPIALADVTPHDVVLELKLEPGLPPAVGDRIQLQQVILNLVRNGFEAMKQSRGAGGTLVVRTARSDPGMIRVSVRDAGLALEDEALGQMFEPFHTTKPDGLGLGLPICRSIVEAHGGCLWATQNEDRGITMHFTLPCGTTG